MTYPNDPECNDWLIGYRIRGRGWASKDPRTVPLQIRCPQHITRWALNSVGVKVTVDLLVRIANAKEYDRQRLVENPLHGQGTPYFLDL